MKLNDFNDFLLTGFKFKRLDDSSPLESMVELVKTTPASSNGTGRQVRIHEARAA